MAKRSSKSTFEGKKVRKGRKPHARVPKSTERKGTGKKTPLETTEKQSSKHMPIPEGGEIVINEQVGVHFRTVPSDCPKVGETITIAFRDEKIFLIAKCITPTKDGNRLVQAFVQKGSGDHAKLAPMKGEKATWKRGGALLIKAQKKGAKAATPTSTK